MQLTRPSHARPGRGCLVILLLSALLTAAACTPLEPQPADAPLDIAIRRQPWNTPSGIGEVIRTEHYRIFTNLPAGQLASALPGVMEAAHATYVEVTGLASPAQSDPLDMYMMASRQDWASVTRLRMGNQAGAALKLEAGAYTVNGVTVCYNIGGLATLAVAAHEGMHQFLYFRLAHRLPLWAEEGLATTAEGMSITGNRIRFTPNRNPMRQNDLRNAILRKQWLPLGVLLRTNPKELVATGRGSPLGYYGQVWALMHWLRNTPELAPKLHRMLRDAAAGRFDQVVPAHHLRLGGDVYYAAVNLPLFRHYFGDDSQESIEALNAAYRAHADNLAGL